MKNTNKIRIEFVGDHCQYLRPMLLTGYERPFIGCGDNEADAYQNAADQVADVHPDIFLPKRYGNKKRGLSHYFGREVAAQIRKSEENELFVYCLVYIPETL